MTTKLTTRIVSSLLWLAAFTTPHLAFALSVPFTYQGRLYDGANPADGTYDFRFRLYDAPVYGSPVGPAMDVNDLVVTNGLFTVTLNAGSEAFDGSARFLEIAVRPGSSLEYTNLAPLQRITSAPYAFMANVATKVTAGEISNPYFLGTTNFAPLNLSVNNSVGLRLEYPTIGTVPNLVGGIIDNSVGSGAEGSVIAGGGSSVNPNSIGDSSDYNTISGGKANKILEYVNYSVIGGGYGNNIGSGQYATIPGGRWNLATDYAFAAGNRAKANHYGAFVWADSQNADFTSTAINEFAARAKGGVRFSSPLLTLSGAANEQAYIGADGSGGDIEIGSRNAAILKVGFWNYAAGTHMNVYAKTFNPTSDRNAKRDFNPVDSAVILEKVIALPLTEWAYKGEPQARHLGPVAQDFSAAFGLGGSDTSIATVDADGVALAALQGLNEKVESGMQEAETKIRALKTENAELKQRLERLEQLLEHKLKGGGK